MENLKWPDPLSVLKKLEKIGVQAAKTFVSLTALFSIIVAFCKSEDAQAFFQLLKVLLE